MNISMTLTADNAAELLTAIQSLAGGLVGSGKKVQEVKAASTNTTVQLPIPELNVTDAGSSEVATVTIEDLRLAVNGKVKAGQRAAVESLLSDFGAARITELPAAKRADFLTQLKAL